jgi:hypothetical protein
MSALAMLISKGQLYLKLFIPGYRWQMMTPLKGKHTGFRRLIISFLNSAD